MNQHIKKVTSVVLVVGMSISLCSVNITKSTETQANDKTVFDEIEKTSITKDRLDDIAQVALEDGAKAAKWVNSYNDTVDYDAALNYALTSYYETENFEQLDEFEAIVDARSADIVEGYKAAAEERAKGDANGYEAGTVIAIFNGESTQDEINAVCEAQYGAVESVYKDFTGDYVATISISLGQTVDMASEAYSGYSITDAVDSNDFYESAETALNTTNDPGLANQYYLDNINVKEAWDYVSTHTHEKVLVGVIDTGVQIDHPDLKNVLSPYSADVTGSSPVLLTECDEPAKTDHGTGVASIIAAEANNSTQMAGVASCYNNDVAEILAIQAAIYSEKDEKYVFSSEDINKALNYCAMQGVKVVNMSLGGESYNRTQEETVNKLTDKGIIVVCSAGNDSSDKSLYPSDLEKTISVVSTENQNYLSAFSNYGSKKDICAPGSNIYMLNKTSGTVYGSGTSMASPVVAAVAAMMCSINSDLNYFDIKRIMANTANELPSQALKDMMPYGVVNADKCIQYAVNYTPNTLFQFEMEPYRNLALQKNVTASSVYNAEELPLSNLVDGDSSTKFVTESDSGQYVEVDLGQIYDIDKIVIDYSRFSTTAYSIKISEDHKQWTEIISRDKEPQYSRGFPIDLSKARYVRIEFTENETYIELAEIEVFGYGETNSEMKDIYDKKESPSEVLEMTANWIFPGAVRVAWKTDANRRSKNYTYNIYADGVLKNAGVTGADQLVMNLSMGTHIFKVTACLGGKESAGTSISTYVGNSMPPTTTTEAPTTTKAPVTTEAPTTTQVEEGPLEVIGMNVSCTADNTIGVVWGQDADRINSGCKYNVYVNGVKTLNEVICNYYTINNIGAGTVQVKVTAVLNGIETAGVTQTINVTGSIASPTTAEPITTASPTTASPITTTAVPATTGKTTTTEVDTTAQAGEGPLEVIGFSVSCIAYNTIGVVWGQDADRINSGCKYNVYVNGVRVLSEVICNYYTINNIGAGNVQIKVTAVLNGIESTGAVQNVDVSGRVIEPITTERTTSAEVTTTQVLPTTREEITTEVPTAEETTTQLQYIISDTNIAIGKTVYSSSNENNELMASNVTDGSMSSRWSSAWSENEWIYIDLGKSYEVAKVKLFWEDAFASNFKLQVSNDAMNWTDVVALGDAYRRDYDVEFAPVNARYVKMKGIHRGTEYGYSLYEIEIYAVEYESTTPEIPDAQLISNGKNAVSSSNEGDGLSAIYAVDGDSSTRWSSTWSDNQWIFVDLGSEKHVSTVEFIWEAAYASQYSVQVSSDGENWRTVNTISNGNGGVESVDVNTNARYVKMQGIKRSTEYGYSLYEMNVYGY